MLNKMLQILLIKHLKVPWKGSVGIRLFIVVPFLLHLSSPGI